MLETLDFTIRIGSTPTFSYFDLLQCCWVNNPVIACDIFTRVAVSIVYVFWCWVRKNAQHG